MRFVVIPSTVFFHHGRTATPKISWRVVDVDAGLTPMKYPKKTVATCNDQAIADRIAAHLNSGTKFDEIAWQGCLDHANRQRGLEKLRGDMLKDEADRLRNQLFEAREQRDEARADCRLRTHELDAARAWWRSDYTAVSQAAVSRTLGVPMADHVARLEAFKAARQNDAIGWTAEEIANLMQERDAARAAPTADALSKAAAQLLIALTLTQVGEGRGWNDVDAALKAVREQLK
jgi:hypothetical protein